MKLIKIVTKVERTPVANLQGMVRISKTEVRLPLAIDWQLIETRPHAQLVISDKVEDKNRVWTAKLVFKTCEELDDLNRWAYLCHLSNGQKRLIGAFDRPYPVTTIQESMPESVTENQLNEVTVSWQTPHFVPSVSE